MKIQNWGYAVIAAIMIIACLFIGFEFGKDYAARNFVTEAVASIDPFIYCDIHEGSVEYYRLDPSAMSYEDMQDYASSLYIEMVSYMKTTGEVANE
jgi:hypothetical protein